MHCRRCRTSMVQTEAIVDKNTFQALYECQVCGEVRLYSRPVRINEDPRQREAADATMAEQPYGLI